MIILLAFYIVGAVLNCVLMVTLREAFVENGKSNKVWLVATLVLTLMSLGVLILGAVVISCDIAIRMISGKKVDYGDNNGDKHGTE